MTLATELTSDLGVVQARFLDVSLTFFEGLLRAPCEILEARCGTSQILTRLIDVLRGASEGSCEILETR